MFTRTNRSFHTSGAGSGSKRCQLLNGSSHLRTTRCTSSATSPQPSRPSRTIWRSFQVSLEASHEPALHTALARAFGSLATPADCYARRAVEGDDGLPLKISGANVLAFVACLRVSACCMPVTEACFPEGKQSKGGLVVVLAACMIDDRAWVMRERPSPAPRL